MKKSQGRKSKKHYGVVSKAPGYDGFNIRCIKHVWPVIGEDFCKAILNFFESGLLPSALNMTWVTLIPKKKEALDIKDFRPISMVGCVYKVIVKILSRRLRGVVQDIVGGSQTAFISGRQILDGALIANEVVQWLRKKKREGVLLKLDFQRAYDTINLDSLDIVLKEMGFDDKWRKWIRACLTTARVSILINGAPSKPFKMRRGLRQGDPLSPYLFVLMAEVLNRMLTKAVEQELFRGIQVGSQNVTLSHLQFADDTILFCEPKLEYLKHIENILYSFQCFSGLTVNYEKSAITAIGKEDEWTARAANMLKCKVVHLPIIYLGIPLGANMNNKASWQPIVDRIQQRLAAWKASTLSRAGKLVLIKAVLSSLPVYYLSLFKMPKKVALEINKIQRRFLWSSKHNSKTTALVKWEIVQKPKKEGGLGVGDLVIKNAALLFKWWWRFACEEGAAWRSVILSIYEDENVMLPTNVQA